MLLSPQSTMGVYKFLLVVLIIKCFAPSNIGARVSQYAFPKDFKFGIATSAIQVEGGWNQSDKTENMWDRYVHTHSQNVADGSNHDVSTDSYHFYKDDVQLVRNMGLDVYRFSISWTRILPTGMDDKISKDGVAYYNNLINELLKYNITPMVTIYHWELPQVLQEFGGWTNPLIVNYFEDYARVVFRLFGDRVKFWLSINEPHQTCHFGYGHVVLVPRYNSTGVGEYLCAHYNLLAHAKVYHLYDTEFRPTQKGIIGVTMDTFYGEPRTNSSQDRDAAEMYNQMHFGLYCHPIFSQKGDYPEVVRRAIDEKSAQQGLSRSRLPSFTAEEVAYIRGTFDFLGLNHYTTVLIQKGAEPPGAELSRPFDMGVYEYRDPSWKMSQSSWHRVFPEGFRKILNWIKREYGDVPIVVTENGISDLPVLEDYDRVEYFNLYLEQLLLALHEDKINVTTYIAWSLMDSFEWLSGYSESFGLHQVDFKSPRKTRTPRLSAHNLKEIVKSRIIDFDKFAAKKN